MSGERRMTVIKDTGTRAMLPPFGEEHEELRETVRRFVAKEIAPNVDEWEAAREFPRELYGRCAELGFLGLKFPEELGGQGGTHLHDAIWVEELARSGGSGGVAAGLNAHTSIAMPPIFNFGTEEQKQRWLVPGIAGEKIGALGITEPGAGSDVAGISTFAEKVDGGYVVNGSKTFITNGVRADFLVCAVKTTKEGGHGGISFLVLEREMPGYEVAQKLEKMGWHSSDTGELAFTDVEVPEENLLGGENEGFKLIMANFAWERLLMAIGAVGAMQRLIETTVAYALEREAFGRPIGKFQAIRHHVVHHERAVLVQLRHAERAGERAVAAADAALGHRRQHDALGVDLDGVGRTDGRAGRLGAVHAHRRRGLHRGRARRA